MHVGAERAFEVIVVDGHDFGVFVAPRRPSADIDLPHQLGVGILVEIEAGQANQGLAILGQEELEVLLPFAAVEGDGQSVEVGEFTGLRSADLDLHVGGNAVVAAHLSLNAQIDAVRRRLRRTAQTNQQKNQDGTPQKGQEEPPVHSN